MIISGMKLNLIEITLLTVSIFFALLSAGAGSNEAKDKGYEIKEVLPPDAIPAIKNPQFVPAPKAGIRPDEPVIGLSINGDNRAYSVYLLNSHEIVNDTVGGKPIAVTW